METGCLSRLTPCRPVRRPHTGETSRADRTVHRAQTEDRADVGIQVRNFAKDRNNNRSLPFTFRPLWALL